MSTCLFALAAVSGLVVNTCDPCFEAACEILDNCDWIYPNSPEDDEKWERCAAKALIYENCGHEY